MPTQKRIARIDAVLSRKQPDLHVVLEEVTNTHNASAVVRTCDAAGVLYVDVIYSEGRALPVNEAISTKAEKWLEIVPHRNTVECLSGLKKRGFQIVATHLKKSRRPYNRVDYTLPTAVIFGNESEGISEAACDWADHIVHIPMTGLVQSLNLSVSVGIILYEAMAQRMARGFFNQTRLSPEELEHFHRKWIGVRHE